MLSPFKIFQNSKIFFKMGFLFSSKKTTKNICIINYFLSLSAVYHGLQPSKFSLMTTFLPTSFSWIKLHISRFCQHYRLIFKKSILHVHVPFCWLYIAWVFLSHLHFSQLNCGTFNLINKLTFFSFLCVMNFITCCINTVLPVSFCIGYFNQ